MLKNIFQQKAVVLERRTEEGDVNYVTIADPGMHQNEDNNDGDDHGGGDDEDHAKYCFCRQESDGETFIECSNHQCRIKWYHINCVGIAEDNIPENEWTCPRCLPKM